MRLDLIGRVRSALSPSQPVVAQPAPTPPEPAQVEPPPPASAARFLLSDPAVSPLLAEIDSLILTTPPADVPALLSSLPLDVFTLCALHRPDAYPNLIQWLPDMPEDSVQLGYTGAAGEQVMLEAAAFVRAVSRRFERGHGPISKAKVLDYGIGWARVARLFYKDVPVDSIYGVDAWEGSVALSRSLRFGGPLALIDANPTSLPFETKFDLVYAFSVFTHLSPRTARAAIAAIRSGMDDDGLLAITIRPSRYWHLSEEGAEPYQIRHNEEGLAYRPLDDRPEDQSSYGDTSMSFDYIRRSWPEFEQVGFDVNGSDPYQLVVYLKPV